jgi:hypothetical protein
MKRNAVLLFAALVAVCLYLLAPAQALALNTGAPGATTKLVFIHHSTGQNWLEDWHGELGQGLMNTNYFVSDTNYGWGPHYAGDLTDIGHWWIWFRSENRDDIMAALYNNSDQHSEYSRLGNDPGGENEIIMFKSCFPNSNLGGSADQVPTQGDNPLRWEDAWSEHMTVGNAKGIYNDILAYFADRQDKLFIVITAPPLSAAETDGHRAANARAFNTWLVNDWLRDYPHRNVAVFDFYNVLTHPDNHHWVQGHEVQHIVANGQNTSAYASDEWDSHPNPAGDLKATSEFVPLLNVYYHCWKGSGDCPPR